MLHVMRAPDNLKCATPDEQALEQALWQHFNRGAVKEAIALCNQLTRDYPDSRSGWQTASMLALRLKKPRQALAAIDKAISLGAAGTDVRLQQAVCFAHLQKISAAQQVLDSLATENLVTGNEYSKFALVLQLLGKHDKAVTYYVKALELDPNNAQHHYNISTAYRYLGQHDQAEAHLNRVIALNPDDADAYYLRAGLRTQTPVSNHTAELRTALRRFNGNTRSKMNIHYALAKELEDIGEYEESFKHLNMGSQIRRANMQYRLESDLATIEKIKSVFVAKRLSGQARGYPSEEPIFVLGMPRTGTTLVERILGNHSSIFAAGELNSFATEITRQAKSKLKCGKLPKEALVEHSANLDFAALGKAYIESTRPATGHTKHFIDKLPFNFLYIGLILLALPNAKIIHLRRHPMDTCYAVYKTLFEAAYPFSYRLDELGHYYLSYRALMDHWERVLPGVIYHIDYEKLVNDTEGETRKLLDHCDLGWEERCLNFHDNPAASTTASASQVRKPIYRSSVGKWRCYADQMQPLVNMLRQAGLVDAQGNDLRGLDHRE